METFPDYSSRTFLLIDDESFMLGLAERILRQCKAGKVLRAANGASALATFDGNVGYVDCIVADLHMRPMNGLELLKAIRTGVSKHMPRDQKFVMLTGDSELEAVRTAIELDINGYILKPISPEKLVTAIERALGQSPALKDVADYRAVPVPAMAG